MTSEGERTVVEQDRTRRRGARWLAVLVALPLLVPAGSVSFAAGPAPADPSVTLGDAWVSPATVQPSSPLGGAFSRTSAWEADVSRAPLNPNSAAMVRSLASQVSTRYGGVAAFNVTKYNTTVYTVPRDQPTVDVAWDDCQRKGYTPRGLLGPDGQFTQVPIPGGAVPSQGSDGQLTVYSPSTDQLWEFWKPVLRADGWHACWGGRIDSVSTSPGYFTGGFGASASGLAVSAGAITLAEAQAGRIDHALSLAIPDPASWKTFSWPAQRSDGSATSTSPIMEGARFRLDPTVDVSRLGLTPLAAMVARAAQTYGFIVTDKAGAVSVSAESATAVVKAGGGTANPWTALMGGKPGYSIMADFPWDRLQALPTDHGKPGTR